MKPFDSVMGICGWKIRNNKGKIMKPIPITVIVRSLIEASKKKIQYNLWRDYLSLHCSKGEGYSITQSQCDHAFQRMIEFIKDNPETGKQILSLMASLPGNPTVKPKVEPKLIQNLRRFIGGKCKGSTTVRTKAYRPTKQSLVFANSLPNVHDKPRRK